MAIILYEKESGKPATFAHIIDAKESLANGFYVQEDPSKKPELPEISEAKPAVIPKVGDKKEKEVRVVEKKEAKPIVSKKTPIKSIKKDSK